MKYLEKSTAEVIGNPLSTQRFVIEDLNPDFYQNKYLTIVIERDGDGVVVMDDRWDIINVFVADKDSTVLSDNMWDSESKQPLFVAYITTSEFSMKMVSHILAIPVENLRKYETSSPIPSKHELRYSFKVQGSMILMDSIRCECGVYIDYIKTCTNQYIYPECGEISMDKHKNICQSIFDVIKSNQEAAEYFPTDSNVNEYVITGTAREFETSFNGAIDNIDNYEAVRIIKECIEQMNYNFLKPLN